MINFFLSLHSEDEVTEHVLQKRKESLIGLDFDNIDTKKLESVAEPYVLLQKAFLEEDIKKKFSFEYRLASYFEEEIVTGIHFSTLSFRDETISSSSGILDEKETIEQNQQNFFLILEKVKTKKLQ